MGYAYDSLSARTISAKMLQRCGRLGLTCGGCCKDANTARLVLIRSGRAFCMFESKLNSRQPAVSMQEKSSVRILYSGVELIDDSSYASYADSSPIPQQWSKAPVDARWPAASDAHAAAAAEI